MAQRQDKYSDLFGEPIGMLIFNSLEGDIREVTKYQSLEASLSWFSSYIYLKACLDQFQVDIEIYEDKLDQSGVKNPPVI